MSNREQLEREVRAAFGGRKVIIVGNSRRAEHELAEIVLYHIGGMRNAPIPREWIDEYGRPDYLIERLREYLDNDEVLVIDTGLIPLDCASADVWFPDTSSNIYITRKFNID